MVGGAAAGATNADAGVGCEEDEDALVSWMTVAEAEFVEDADADAADEVTAFPAIEVTAAGEEAIVAEAETEA